MYCTQCREVVENTETYCSACGAPVKHHTPLVETPEETVSDSESTTLIERIWDTFKVLSVAIAILVGVGAMAFYGLFLYASCRMNGSVTIPGVGVSFECERSPEDIARKTETESLEERRPAAVSPYDSIRCVGLDYELYVALVPYDDSEQGSVLAVSYQNYLLAFLREINFPKHLVKGRFIGIVSPTYDGGTITLRGRTYDVPKVGSAQAIVFSDGTMLLYRTALGERFRASVAHELGHIVGNTFTTGAEVHEKRQFLNFLLQNCQLEGKNLTFSMRYPFDRILATSNRPIGLRR